MSAPSPADSEKPSREMIHEALRGWPALHTYVLPEDQPAQPGPSAGGAATR
jgi:hypothetical protein